MSKKTQLFLLLAIWIISSIIGMPNLITYKLFNSNNSSYCHSTNSHIRQYLHLTQFITLYVLPLLVMAVLYCHIGYKLTQSINLLRSNTNVSVSTINKSFHRLSAVEFSCTSNSVNVNTKYGLQRQSMPCLKDTKRRRSSAGSFNERKKVIKMLVVVVLLFSLSRLPRHIWCFIYFHKLASMVSIEFGLLFPPISFFCYYLSSALNPFVYFLFSNSMKKSAKNAFCFYKSRSNYLKIDIFHKLQ